MNTKPNPMTSFKKFRDFVFTRVAEDGDCWLWQGAFTNQGTPFVQVKRTKHTVRRQLALLRRGNDLPAGHIAYATCGDNRCVNPEHIGVITRNALLQLRSNEASKVDRLMRRLRISKAQSSAKSKVSDADIQAIRASTETSAAWAERLGVSVSSISHYRTGLRRKDYVASPFTGLLKA